MSTERAVLHGTPVSSGIAIAKAYVYRKSEMHVQEERFAQGQEREQLLAFEEVYGRAEGELDALCGASAEEDASKTQILAAHREILRDEEVLGEIREAISRERLTPASAIYRVYTQFAELLAGVEDKLIAGRAADLYDVRDRLLRICTGGENRDLSMLSEDVIVVAHDLLPSDTATMDRAHVKGIVTETGGANSHSAILARSFRIPAILGVPDALSRIADGALLAMDATTGELFPKPEEEVTEKLSQKREQLAERRRREETYRDRPALTKDGTRLQIGLNLGGKKSEPSGQFYDFVGLFRTEFLYMEAEALPDEETQFAAYRRVVEQAEGRPVTLRTLDIGGDKTLPYMELPKEDNPFLGKRALRLCLDETALFQAQLLAALRASAYGRLQIMFPMVGSIEDIRRAKEQLALAKRTLDERGVAYDPEIRVGIMIEIPSIALLADLAAQEVDFASIGSNDLTQYVCAADRMNPQVSDFYQNLSPAMLRILFYVFSEFTKRGKEISVCGEMAGDPASAVLLSGLGARKLSMSPANVSGVKAALAEISIEDAEKMAQRCMQMPTEAEVRQYLHSILSEENTI